MFAKPCGMRTASQKKPLAYGKMALIFTAGFLAVSGSPDCHRLTSRNRPFPCGADLGTIGSARPKSDIAGRDTYPTSGCCKPSANYFEVGFAKRSLARHRVEPSDGADDLGVARSGAAISHGLRPWCAACRSELFQRSEP